MLSEFSSYARSLTLTKACYLTPARYLTLASERQRTFARGLYATRAEIAAESTAEARHQDNGANELAWPWFRISFLMLRLAFSEDSGMAIGVCSVFNILHDSICVVIMYAASDALLADTKF